MPPCLGGKQGPMGEPWMTAERTHHIRVEGNFSSLTVFLFQQVLNLVLLRLDNTTVATFINRMGKSLLYFFRPFGTDLELVQQQRDYNPCTSSWLMMCFEELIKDDNIRVGKDSVIVYESILKPKKLYLLCWVCHALIDNEAQGFQ